MGPAVFIGTVAALAGGGGGGGGRRPVKVEAWIKDGKPKAYKTWTELLNAMKALNTQVYPLTAPPP